MTYTESQFEMPNGKYLARFLGVSMRDLKPGEKPKIGQDGNPMPPAMTWNFEIIEGEQAGKRSDRLTGRVPTAKNGCGKMLAAISDKILEEGEEVDIDAFIGRVYRITVMDNRISDSAPPTLVHDHRPASSGSATPSASDPNARWDYSDGAAVAVNQTTADVQAFFDQSKVEPTRIRVKPAGAPKEQAKTADQWGFRAASTEQQNDPIPF